MAKIKTKRERVKFASDNVAGACPEVLDAILKANDGVIVDKANALAAVPEAVGKTITSFSNISENLSCNSVDI